MSKLGYKITIEIKGEMDSKDEMKIDQGKFKNLVKRHIEKTLGCKCSVRNCEIQYGGKKDEKKNDSQMETTPECK